MGQTIPGSQNFRRFTGDASTAPCAAQSQGGMAACSGANPVGGACQAALARSPKHTGTLVNLAHLQWHIFANKTHAHALLTQALAARKDDCAALCSLAKLSSELSQVLPLDLSPAPNTPRPHRLTGKQAKGTRSTEHF